MLCRVSIEQCHRGLGLSAPGGHFFFFFFFFFRLRPICIGCDSPRDGPTLVVWTSLKDVLPNYWKTALPDQIDPASVNQTPAVRTPLAQEPDRRSDGGANGSGYPCSTTPSAALRRRAANREPRKQFAAICELARVRPVYVPRMRAASPPDGVDPSEDRVKNLGDTCASHDDTRANHEPTRRRPLRARRVEWVARTPQSRAASNDHGAADDHDEHSWLTTTSFRHCGSSPATRERALDARPGPRPTTPRTRELRVAALPLKEARRICPDLAEPPHVGSGPPEGLDGRCRLALLHECACQRPHGRTLGIAQ